jgi:hypothetical protein
MLKWKSVSTEKCKEKKKSNSKAKVNVVSRSQMRLRREEKKQQMGFHESGGNSQSEEHEMDVRAAVKAINTEERIVVRKQIRAPVGV